MNTAQILKFSSLVIVGSVIVGCSYATKEEVAALRSELQTVKQTADSASTTVDELNLRSKKTEEQIARNCKKCMRR